MIARHSMFWPMHWSCIHLNSCLPGHLLFPSLRVDESISVDLRSCAERTPSWSGTKLRACSVGTFRHSTSCSSEGLPPSVSTRGQEERSTSIWDEGRTFRTPVPGSDQRGRNDVEDVSDGGLEAMAERHPPKTAS